MFRMLPTTYLLMLILFSTISHLAKGILDPAQETRCLSCIRNTSSLLGIDTTKRCEGYYCGQYQISYTYWAEAGKPGNNQGARDYEKCARDKSCAEQTVKAYFKKFKRDCNNDGLIDCIDMAALHKGGPTSCSSDWFFKSRYWLAFNKTVCVTDRDSVLESKLEYEESLRQPVVVIKNQTLTTECLDCICDAVSGCNTSVNNCGSGTVCGPFAISQAYWKDGRRPGASWTACSRTKECSSVTVKNYMEKHKRDCNDDGLITCEDYAAIHRRGARSCSNKDLMKDHYWNKFLACRASQRPVKDVNMVKVYEGSDDSIMSSSSLVSRGDQSSHLGGSSSFSPASQPSSTPMTSFERINPPSNNNHQVVHHASNVVANSNYQTTPSATIEVTPQASNPNREDDSYKLLGISKPSRQTLDNQRHQHNSGQGAINEMNKRRNELFQEKKTDNFQDTRTFTPPGVASDITHSGGKSTEHTGSHILSSRPLSIPASSATISTTSTPGTITTSSTTTTTTTAPTIAPTTLAATIANMEYISTEISQEPVLNSSKRQPLLTESQTTNQLHQEQNQPSNVPSDENSDYPSTDFFRSQSIGNDKTISFDKVISGIVDSPEFSNSYQPFPELNSQDSKNSDENLGSKRLATTMSPRSSSRSTQKSSSQIQIIGAPNRVITKNNQRHSTLPPSASSYSPSNIQPNAAPPTDQQVDKITEESQPILVPVFGVDSVNMSSLFEKGLNESSRITSDCLECICDASSNCDSTVQCISKQREKNRCGLYMISWNQYQESDISLTSLALDPAGGEDSADEKMYYDCTTDKICAEKLIHLYIEKHQKDCNNDGKIDCYDIAAIHRVGPDNCNSNKFLSSQYWKDFNICYATDRLATTVQTQAPSSQLLY